MQKKLGEVILQFFSIAGIELRDLNQQDANGEIKGRKGGDEEYQSLHLCFRLSILFVQFHKGFK